MSCTYGECVRMRACLTIGEQDTAHLCAAGTRYMKHINGHKHFKHLRHLKGKHLMGKRSRDDGEQAPQGKALKK
eukprot:1142435-Pelagomonas_calceolata.AAC.7